MPNVIAFWNDRAGLGEKAGTQDVVLKRLEIAELIKRVPRGSHVLDVGCGNGLTLAALQNQLLCQGYGFDVAPKMVMAARSLCVPGVEFKIATVLAPLPGKYDIAISERCLINLSSSDEQEYAFHAIMERLRPGGTYFMIENSINGLGRLNALRIAVGLPAMTPPWHNLYFDEKEVASWASENYVLESIIPFASTYYFLSRVVYAKLNEGKDLDYESPINMLALALPPVGDLGATRLWVWKKA